MNTLKKNSMQRMLGSATLSQLAFPEESNPIFPWEKSYWDNTVVKRLNKETNNNDKKTFRLLASPFPSCVQRRPCSLLTLTFSNPVTLRIRCMFRSYCQMAQHGRLWGTSARWQATIWWRLRTVVESIRWCSSAFWVIYHPLWPMQRTMLSV